MHQTVFRKSIYNRNSIASLLGYFKNNPIKNHQIHLVQSVHEGRTLFPSGPDFIAYSFTTWQKDDVYTEVERLRKKWKKTIFIAGGPHPTVEVKDVLENGFDKVFKGEAERSMVRFMRTPELFPDAVVQSDNNYVHLDEIDPFLPKLGLLPPLEITRGCFYGCNYCQTHQHFTGPVRHRSLDSAISWFKKMKQTSRERIRFISPDAFSYGASHPSRLDPKAIKALLEAGHKILKKPMFIGTFPSEIRPESCLPEMVRHVKTYCNNKQLTIGAQSGSNRMLELMRRGHSTENIEEAVKVIADHRFKPVVDFIFGLPLEQQEDRQLTRVLITRLIKKYQATIRGHLFLPLPGTEWANKIAGSLTEGDKAFLGNLEKKGQLIGSWKKQELKNQ